MSDTKALAIIPRTIDEVHSLAEVLAKSTLIPDALRNKVPDVVVSILAGQELGLSPMAAIRGVHVVQGKPVLSADTMVALVLSSGLAEYFQCVEDTDARVTYETKRRGAPATQRASWTTEDTKRAGLNTKDNWRLYTRSMMKARAKAILARDAYPDVLAGVYDSDEIHQAATPPAPVVDVEDAEIISVNETPLHERCARAETIDELEQLAPVVGRLTKGSPARILAAEAYNVRKTELKKATAAA
jgi:hypothetical protein